MAASLPSTGGAGGPAAHAVAVLNQKGGVGKTTVTLGLASAAAAAGRAVLVVDLDPQGSSTWVMGHEGDGSTVTDVMAGGNLERAIVSPGWATGVDLVPGGGGPIKPTGARRLRDSLAALDRGRYDAVLLDCPPTLSGPTIGALTAARHALIVVDPSALGLRGIGAVADAVDDAWQDANPHLELCGVVVNRMPAVSIEAERRLDELGRIVGRSTIWKPPVPQRVIVNQALGERRPIHAFGSRAADVSAAFDSLWAKLRRVVRA